jgi:drug/metabolite transporter (DMT)-like permease
VSRTGNEISEKSTRSGRRSPTETEPDHTRCVMAGRPRTDLAPHLDLAAGSSRPRAFLTTGVLALATLALVWGYNWVVMKIGLRYTQPFTFAALRTLLGAALLYAVMLLTRRPLRPAALGLTLAVGLLQTTGFVGLTVWALESGGAGKVAVLVYTMPFWLLLMAWVVLGERLKGLQWLAVAVAFAGLVFVLSPWQLHGLFSSALAVAGGFLWAASAVVVKILDRRHHKVDLLSLTAWQSLLGALPLVVIALATWSGPPVWTTTLVVTLAYNVVLGNALAWFLWLYVLRVLSAGAAGLGTLAIPVVGVLAAWLQLGEQPSSAEGLGMVLIVAALAMLAATQLVPSGRVPG